MTAFSSYDKYVPKFKTGEIYKFFALNHGRKIHQFTDLMLVTTYCHNQTRHQDWEWGVIRFKVSRTSEGFGDAVGSSMGTMDNVRGCIEFTTISAFRFPT